MFSPAGFTSRLAGALLALGLLLVWAPVRAQLTLVQSFYLSPGSATSRGTISIGATRLADGHYEVALINGRTPIELVDIAAGTGEFQRYVKVPTLPVGIYAVELRVDGLLQESRNLKVLAPLAVSSPNSNPRAGSALAFTVTGLTRGSLSLAYAGKTAFGPVNVETGSYSGKLVLPTDRPASLPASVALEARNAIGKTIPRVGSTTLAVQSPDRNPLVRIGSSSTTSSSVALRQNLSFTGNLATNDLELSRAQVQYWWKGADGRVMPMGAQQSAIGSDGNFSVQMLAPQLGTMSAGRADGAGTVFGVGRAEDRYGTMQQRPGFASQMSVSRDTDAAVDINLTLLGADGVRIKDARVVLGSSQLDELYPSNDNNAPIRLDGGVPPSQMVSQFSSSRVRDELIGCPDDLERQTADINGKVEFQFGLSLPQGGYNVDGSGPPPSLTIEPTQDCVEIPTNSTGGNTSASDCTLVDPAGIHATLEVIAAHTGYGWLTQPQGNGFPIERTLKIDLRIDRYTGSIHTRVCRPDASVNYGYLEPCTEATFQRSANLTVTLPKLTTSGLLLTDPTWTEGANVTWPLVTGRNGMLLDYAPMPDLSAFEGKARFEPTQPLPRVFNIGYVRGAGNTLASARLHLPGETPIDLGKRSGGDSCDSSATEVWGVESALQPRLATFLQKLRFPGSRFGTNSVIGYVVARESGTERFAVRVFRFHFAATDATTAALATQPCPAGQPSPCVVIGAYNPHQVKVTMPPADPAGTVSTGNGNTGGCEGSDCDNYSELHSKTNQAQAHLDQEFCLPKGANQCGSYSAVDSSHQQYSRAADVPPPGVGFTGAGGDSQTDAPWEVLFEKTIPLFRWYWGVPEVLSAEVFADLGLKAEYLFNYVIKPLEPLTSYVETGGRMDIAIAIGVDVDVLFGILVDAGAAITGHLTGEVVARAKANAPTSPCIDEKLDFGMDFSYWVEIGCPIPNPFDPTCYIPDIEGSHNIFNENISDGNSCLAGKRGANQLWHRIESRLAAVKAGQGVLPPAQAVMAVSPEVRRSMNRHPAVAVDSAGNKLALYITGLGKLVANDIPADGVRSTVTLSEAYGLRDVAVMHYGADRAVAVWAQSDLTSPPRQAVVADLASRQHLRFAIFDGDSWSAAQNLTSPGFGEGGVRLARCKPRPLSYRTDCVNTKVGLVFQRNTARRIGGESHVFLSQFNGTGWSTPQQVDKSGKHNITPAIAYRNAQPVVAWVRYAPDTTGRSDVEQLSDVTARNFALRAMDGTGEEEVDTRITRVAQPELAATSDGRLALAYTRAAAGQAFVGTRQALHLGERTCLSGVCSLRSFAVRDPHGRLLYGERPRMVANASGGVSVLFRGLAFGPLAGAASPESNLLPDDPIGMVTTRGELLEVRSRLAANTTYVLGLTNDAGGHLQGTLAFDEVAQEIVAISSVLPQDALLAKRLAAAPVQARAKVESVDDGIQLSSLADLPDLALASIDSPASRLDPGATLTATVKVVNRGSDWTPNATRLATLRLFWDEPQARETHYGNVTIPALAPGATHTAAIQVTIPAVFANDERQTLRAELLIEDDDGELDGGNNAAGLAIGGMPVPANMRALSVPGSRIVNLAWDDPADARVAGYRIWIDDENGEPVPVGSSFNPGFADLSALFGFERRYRVSTYSARGIESMLSEPLLAAPAAAIIVPGDSETPPSTGPSVFEDGFE